MRINQLCAGYGKEEVLHNLNYTIQRNQITAIVGQSGCGKSTLLKCLNRMIRQEGGWMKGEFYLGDKNMQNVNDESLRQRIGMVSQTPVVFPFSIVGNLKCVFHYYGLPKLQMQVELERVLKQVKLYDEIGDRLNDPASELSGGQKQRLSIARALCARPEILLLDEPCSSLDLMNTIAIEELLISLLGHLTIVIVTHNLSQAERIADQVLFMHEGTILEATKKQDFFASPKTKLAENLIQYM